MADYLVIGRKYCHFRIGKFLNFAGITNIIKAMEISIKEENLMVSVNIPEEEGKDATCEQVMLAAFDAMSRIYSDEQVIKAYYAVDPDTMALRD